MLFLFFGPYINPQMKMRGKLSCSSLRAIPAVPHKPQYFSCLYLISLFEIPPVRRKMGIIKISSALAADTDPPASQGEPANLLYTPIRDTYYRIIAADAPAPENIAAFMKSFSPIASLLMPAVLKKNSSRLS